VSGILLTGGTGMVGRNLLENEAFSSFQIHAPTRGECDLRDPVAVDRLLRQTRPSLIVHAAGRVGGIAANIADQAGFYLDNVKMGMVLTSTAAALGVPRFLNFSTSCVYPASSSSPLTEDLLFSGPVETTNEGYALAKLSVLRLGEWLERQTEGFSFRSLIPCNLYGRWDHFEPLRSHLLAAIISKIHEARTKGSAEVTIWGDGSARREFMYAADLARCVVWAIERFDDLPMRMNVGVGIDHSVDEYYRIVADVLDYDGAFIHDLERPSGIRRKLVDIELQKRFGWMPSIGLEAGIRSTYEHYLEEHRV
jgi:GDP-L-fucose synthase